MVRPLAAVLSLGLTGCLGGTNLVTKQSDIPLQPNEGDCVRVANVDLQDVRLVESRLVALTEATPEAEYLSARPGMDRQAWEDAKQRYNRVFHERLRHHAAERGLCIARRSLLDADRDEGHEIRLQALVVAPPSGSTTSETEALGRLSFVVDGAAVDVVEVLLRPSQPGLVFVANVDVFGVEGLDAVWVDNHRPPHLHAMLTSADAFAQAAAHYLSVRRTEPAKG